jgi:hypothetical protein
VAVGTRKRAWVKAKHPPTIPNQFYPPLGRLIAGWTFTELYLQSITWHVLKVRDIKKARLLTWGRNANEVVKLFISLERWLPDALKKEHHAIFSEAERLRAARNKLAHGLWAYLPGKPAKSRVWRIYFLRENKQKIDPDTHVYTPVQVQRLADDLDALNLRLRAFHKVLRAPIP